ncbi:MAG: gliding motility protein GldN [Saprospiraceae bacterium]|jgi:gliding motility associated protien GldN|nr:gliding motility protein GldN [Saprospiraceae bacterium]
MKSLQIFFLGLLLVALSVSRAQAQEPEVIRTESSDPNAKTPLDGVVERTLTAEKRVLPYDHVREADYYWEKKVWRLLDIREKMNLPFANPDGRFIDILLSSIKEGEITVYDDERFTKALTLDEAMATTTGKPDTILTYDPETYEEIIQVVRNDLNPDDIKRFRIKEVWFFDKETSTVKVRILGIAPIRELKDDNGNIRGELPMFWVYYPDARYMFARHTAFRTGNDASPLTWEDILEMRFFSSHIYKERNVLDLRLKDIYSGVDLLLEGEKIKQEIFNFEHDLWSF